MSTKRGLQLDRVVLLGRTFDEYRRYFLLNPEDLVGKTVLDVASGVSSFCAEANARGIRVTSFDPIYSLTPEKIAERCEPDLKAVFRAIGSVQTKILNTCANYASALPLGFCLIIKRIPSATCQAHCRSCRSQTIRLI